MIYKKNVHKKLMLTLPRKKGEGRVAVQARISRELYAKVSARLKENGSTWQSLLEATCEAYAEGAIFYTPE